MTVSCKRIFYIGAWVLIGALAGCGQTGQSGGAASPAGATASGASASGALVSGASAAGASADSVKAFRLFEDTAQKVISLPGELLPYEQVLVRAKVPGYIRKMNVDIGSVVSKGQVLALVDAPEVSIRVQEMTERVKAARSKYAASKDYYDRISEASKADGVVAAGELQKVQQQMLADSADYSAAQLSAASYREIGSYLAIVAPVAGIITKRNIVVGSFVGNAGDAPLFELQNNRVLRLHVPVPEVYANAVLLGNTGELTTRSLPDRKFAARLVRKAGSIDGETRSEVWEFEIPNGEATLKAGSYADVRLRFVRGRSSLVAPLSAVVTSLERRFVIRVRDGVTQWVDVRPGFNMGDRIELFGDLAAGDTLVSKATEELKGGTKVIPSFTK